MSAIASNSRNSLGVTIGKIYSGRGGVGIRNPSPLEILSAKSNWVTIDEALTPKINQARYWTSGKIVASGMGGRDFSIPILPTVRKRNARDYT